MKRIAIATLNGYYNYGNRLQNYALQEVLKTLQNKVVTLRFSRIKKHYGYKYYLRKIKGLINKRSRLESKRNTVFIDFSHKYIIETERLYNLDDDLTQLNNNYDYFVVGSDQVWNPNINRLSSFFFLGFADSYKRIAYAASFGISTLPEQYREMYKLWLTQMEHISVREEAGARIVKELTGRDVPVLIDPTLMLSKDKWLTITKRHSHKPNNPYLLTYFLGKISSDVIEFINKIKQENKLEVISMADINDTLRYSADPGEFLDYLNSSEIFITDSFHGAVFSILFEKPFIVCERISKTMSMNSRIETLLTKFKLEDRKWENIRDKDNIFDIDFSHIPGILDAERKKSFDYLKNALNIKDED